MGSGRADKRFNGVKRLTAFKENVCILQPLIVEDPPQKDESEMELNTHLSKKKREKG